MVSTKGMDDTNLNILFHDSYIKNGKRNFQVNIIFYHHQTVILQGGVDINICFNHGI